MLVTGKNAQRCYKRLIYATMFFMPLMSTGQGFRGYPWGTSLNNILNKEPGKPEDYYKRDHSLFYRSASLAGDLSAIATFQFNQSYKLVSGAYTMPDFLNDKDWDRLLRSLSSKYGKRTAIADITKTKYHVEYHWQTSDAHIMTIDDVHTYVHFRNINYYSLAEWNRLKREEANQAKNKLKREKEGL